MILPTPRECQRHCTVNVKLVDDVVEGRVVERTRQYLGADGRAGVLVIDRESDCENRRTERALRR